MAQLPRVLQKIFCGGVPATNNVAVFGSLKAGAPSYSDSVAIIQSLPAFEVGWSGATILNQAPALQDMNALFYVLSNQIAYLLQNGIPEYLSTETYYENSLCTSGGVIYKSVVDANVGQALTNSLFWMPIVTSNVVSTSSAYAIINSDSVVKATGAVDFTITLPQAVATNAGEKHTIKSVTTSNALITIVGTGGSLIDGQASFVLSPYASVTVISDGTGWMVV